MTMPYKNDNDEFHEVLQCILEPAREVAILFGLLDRKQSQEVYVSKTFHGHTYSIAKRELPNRYARLDILYIDNTPAGSVVATRISSGLYHMVGMFIKEGYRSNSVFETLNVQQCSDQNSQSLPMPSKFLLAGLLEDLFKHRMQMTLEVMNNNRGACNLYESKFLINNSENIELGFELMSRDNIAKYSRLRRKRIGNWHVISESDEHARYGVQWSHVPNYNNSSRWSISRVYQFMPFEREFESLDKQPLLFVTAVQFVVTIFSYGSIRKYILYKVVNKGR